MKNKISLFLSLFMNFALFINLYNGLNIFYNQQLPDPIVRKNLPSNDDWGPYCFNYNCQSTDMALYWSTNHDVFYVYEWEVISGLPVFSRKLQFEDIGYSSASWGSTAYSGKKLSDLYNGTAFGEISSTADLKRNGETVRQNTNQYLLNIHETTAMGSSFIAKIASGLSWYYDYNKNKSYMQLGIHLKVVASTDQKGWVGAEIGHSFKWQ